PFASASERWRRQKLAGGQWRRAAHGPRLPSQAARSGGPLGGGGWRRTAGSGARLQGRGVARGSAGSPPAASQAVRGGGPPGCGSLRGAVGSGEQPPSIPARKSTDGLVLIHSRLMELVAQLDGHNHSEIKVVVNVRAHWSLPDGGPKTYRR
ncbi:unnamed protein product, partial [Urochloa humidicola]